jgi:hypothetical protein
LLVVGDWHYAGRGVLGGSTMPEPLLLTVPQVMDRLQVGKHAVYQLIRTQRSGRSASVGPAASRPPL